MKFYYESHIFWIQLYVIRLSQSFLFWDARFSHFCKKLSKTSRFWFFPAETEILLWKSCILCLFVYIWCFSIISFLRYKIQPFLQKLAKNSQILIFFSWNWNFTIKVIYSAFIYIHLVFHNHFLSEMQDSAIYAKISQKQPDFDFFSAETEILL